MTEHEKQKDIPSRSKSIEDGIGIRLKAAREGKGLSQSDLHRITGLSRMVISKYEAGLNKPGARELRLLCDALDVSPNILIYGTEEPHYQAGGLAHEILAMGDAGAAMVASLSPMIGAMLGKDDTRSVLNLVESLLKAKSPKQYEGLMELFRTFKEELDKVGDAASLMTVPGKMDAFNQRITEKAAKIVTKLNTDS